MFGCHALFRGENVFGLVWKEGRIGVRLPDDAAFETLMSLDGADRWIIGPKTIALWVFVPTSMHASKAKLKSWVAKAHEVAGATSKPKKKAKKTK